MAYRSLHTTHESHIEISTALQVQVLHTAMAPGTNAEAELQSTDSA